MKTVIFLFALIAFPINSIAQFNEDKALYLQKVEKYRKMKNAGQVLTFGGSVMTIVGLVMISNAAENSVNRSGQAETHFGTGVAVYLLGGCAVGAGVPLWIVGGINKGRYERKLNTVTASVNLSPQNTGVRLRYRF